MSRTTLVVLVGLPVLMAVLALLFDAVGIVAFGWCSSASGV